jgi:hypothetical protein
MICKTDGGFSIGEMAHARLQADTVNFTSRPQEEPARGRVAQHLITKRRNDLRDDPSAGLSDFQKFEQMETVHFSQFEGNAAPGGHEMRIWQFNLKKT